MRVYSDVPWADGTGPAAQFNYPVGLAFDGSGNTFIADSQNHRIRRMTTAGVVTTFAGTGKPATTNGPAASAEFNDPVRLAIDATGNLYVAEYYGNVVRKITTSGIGELVVSWTAASSLSPITGYQATATASGQPSRRCTTTGALSCTISGAVSGLTYTIVVTATSAAGTSLPSTPVVTAPN